MKNMCFRQQHQQVDILLILKECGTQLRRKQI